MSARPTRVLIEFTKDTKNVAGEVVRTAGETLLVDPMSAASFVKKGVAKELSDKQAEKVTEKKPAEPTGPVGGVG